MKEKNSRGALSLRQDWTLIHGKSVGANYYRLVLHIETESLIEVNYLSRRVVPSFLKIGKASLMMSLLGRDLVEFLKSNDFWFELVTPLSLLIKLGDWTRCLAENTSLSLSKL